MSYNPYSLEGKTILITGASSGIGRETAIQCSKMGAKVILTARNEVNLKETMNLLEGDGHKYIIADLNKSEDLLALVDELPIIDGCVNNAGYNITELVQFIKEDDMDQIFRVNTLAPIFLTRSIVRKKKMAKNSSIVFTSSISGIGAASPGNSLYASTKGALNGFMKTAALELAAKEIRCNAVLPGMVETPLKEGKNITEEQWEANRKLYPLKRFGKPIDVALAIVFLLSEASCWITGTELIIDGGRRLN